MLYICTKSHDDKIWHVGGKVPTLTECVEEIQADGHELDWVHRNIRTVPQATGPVGLWKHGQAQHIYNQMRQRTV